MVQIRLWLLKESSENGLSLRGVPPGYLGVLQHREGGCPCPLVMRANNQWWWDWTQVSSGDQSMCTTPSCLSPLDSLPRAAAPGGLFRYS